MKAISGRLIAAVATAFGVFAANGMAATVAQDDAQSYSGYAYGNNGGSGFGASTYLEGTNGGIYLETGSRSIDGSKSFAMYSDTGEQALARTISTPSGGWTSNFNRLVTITTSLRFDLSNTTGFSGFNIKTASGSTFAANQLIRIGMSPSDHDRLKITAGNSPVLTFSGDSEIRGDIIDVTLNLDTVTGSYSAFAYNRQSNVTSSTVTGSLTSGLGSFNPGSWGIANFNTGSNQNFIWDNMLVVAVPEPTVVAGAGLIGLVALKRRRGV